MSHDIGRTLSNLRRSIAALTRAAAPSKKMSLLSLKQTVGVSGAEAFVVADHFKVDTSEKAKVKIAYLSTNFTTHFMSKREDNVPAGELNIHTLLESSVDTPIIDELGARYKTYFADLWALLEKQPNGEGGSLRVNRRHNILYIEGPDGKFWKVLAYWDASDGGWCVYGHSFEKQFLWGAGSVVVSR